MTQIRKNILANFAGQGWAALMQIIFIPIYIKFLGIEAYGLIGFYAVLQGILQILDLGLSPTMIRELARFSALPEESNDSRTFVRTLETIYWGIAFLIGCCIFFAAPFIATHWLHASSLSIDTVQTALRLIGVIAALQWPLSFYQGGLLGLQKLVLLNGIKIGNSTVFACGAAILVAFISRSIVAFFLWQVVVSALNVGVLTFSVWKHLPKSEKPASFDTDVLRRVRTFAGGMTGVMVTGIVVSQIDKLMVSKMLPLREFGFYSLAFVLSNGLILVIIPIFNALLTRFSELVAKNNKKELSRLYHLGSQSIAVLEMPLAAILILFSFDILWFWTGNSETARNTFEIAQFLILGSMLNGLTYPQQALQQANAWTTIGIGMNLLFLVILVPLILLLLPVYGAVGAAFAWMFVNILYVALSVPLTHRRLLKGGATKWFKEDSGPIFGIVLILAVIYRILLTKSLHSFTGILIIGGLLLITTLAAGMASPQLRPLLVDYFRRKREES